MYVVATAGHVDHGKSTLVRALTGIEPDRLGPPCLIIRPEPGDLILFNSRRMHAVTPGNDQPRLSLSCFVGYRGVAEPLTYWS